MVAISPRARRVFLVLVRGETFRSGGKASRAVTSDVLPELRALDSMLEHVVRPAVHLGWSVQCFAHVASLGKASTTHGKLFLEYFKTLFSPSAILVEQILESTQALSLLRSLLWLQSSAAKLGFSHSWGAMLILRADQHFKASLPLPPVFSPGCDIIAAYRMGHGPVDTLWFLPRCRVGEFAEQLKRHQQSASLHGFCGWVSGLSYFLPSQHVANTAAGWNPLYRLIGRNHSLRPPELTFGGKRVQAAPCRPFPCQRVCTAEAGVHRCARSIDGAARLVAQANHSDPGRRSQHPLSTLAVGAVAAPPSRGRRAPEDCCDCARPEIRINASSPLWYGFERLALPNIPS